MYSHAARSLLLKSFNGNAPIVRAHVGASLVKIGSESDLGGLPSS